MHGRLLAASLALCFAMVLPASMPRAETADSIMESKKTLPRHNDVKSLGVHHTTVCPTSRQCRSDHKVWFCSRMPTANGEGRCVCRPTARFC